MFSKVKLVQFPDGKYGLRTRWNIFRYQFMDLTCPTARDPFLLRRDDGTLHSDCKGTLEQVKKAYIDYMDSRTKTIIKKNKEKVINIKLLTTDIKE